MLRIAKTFLCIGLALLAGAASPWADSIFLKPNNMVIGEVVSTSADYLVIESFGTQLLVRRDQVTRIIESEGMQATETVLPGATGPAVPAGATAPISQVPFETPFALPETPTESPTGASPAASLNKAPLLPVTIPTGRAFVVTGYGVSFREGPSLEYPVITKLQGRDLLVEIESREEWMHAKTVSDPPQEGWVSTSFVQAMLNEPCQVTGASVNVRESPDMVGRILGRLNQGDVVMKLEERENWWLILKNVTTAGWVSSQYLKPLENEDLYRPRMQVTQNDELANPVQVTRESTETGGERLIFTTPGERFARNGMTKLLVLHRNQQEFAQSASQYKGESILARNQFESALQMTEAGLPQNLAAMYVGAEVLTLLGNRTPGGWQYEITAPTLRTAHFAFIAQSGAQRGEVVVVKANP